MQLPTPTNQPIPSATKNKRWYDRNGILIAWLIIFWPIGLFALWKRQSTSKGKKIVVSSIVCGLFALFVFAGIMANIEIDKKLSAAESYWTEGKKVESCNLYKQLLKTYPTSLESEESYPTILSRVIETDLEQGNADYARTLVEKALRKNVSLNLESEQAKALYSEMQISSASKSSEEIAQEAKSKAVQQKKESSADTDVKLVTVNISLDDYTAITDSYKDNCETVRKLIHSTTGAMADGFRTQNFAMLAAGAAIWEVGRTNIDRILEDNKSIERKLQLKMLSTNNRYLEDLVARFDKFFYYMKTKGQQEKALPYLNNHLVDAVGKFQANQFGYILAIEMGKTELK